MRDFRAFIYGLTHALQQILYEELLVCGAEALPPIPWDALMDDPVQGQPGWCFLNDPRTKLPVNGAEWMMTRISREANLQRLFLDSQKGQFRTTTIRSYLRAVVRFREKLSVAVHITGGQPSRAPELLSVRHRNTETAHRNIFIEDRLVVIATSYHKGFYTRNDTKLIYRYLPQQTPTRTAEAYIWALDPSTGRVWSSSRFREALRNESAIGLYGHTLNISSYRDIAIGISRRFLRIASAFPQNSYEEGDTEKEIEDSDNIDLEGSTGFNSILGHIADLQAAYSSHVAGFIYGREITKQAGSTVQRREILERFRGGMGKVLVATNALGMGIDIPDIRCVIYLGWPRTMLDYSQESGRAGRDGQPSEAIIIQLDSFHKPPIWFQLPAGADEKQVQAHQADIRLVREYLDVPLDGCRRVVLDGYLNGDFDGRTRIHCGDIIA
ncbi:hypothetical protein N7491_011239 [Penicillium cf. griseofulvum]|nr:hypothetical protein N7491_011239 [Penicillium cf. griseofulvum]